VPGFGLQRRRAERFENRLTEASACRSPRRREARWRPGGADVDTAGPACPAERADRKLEIEPGGDGDGRIEERDLRLAVRSPGAKVVECTLNASPPTSR